MTTNLGQSSVSAAYSGHNTSSTQNIKCVEINVLIVRLVYIGIQGQYYSRQYIALIYSLGMKRLITP